MHARQRAARPRVIGPGDRRVGPLIVVDALDQRRLVGANDDAEVPARIGPGVAGAKHVPPLLDGVGPMQRQVARRRPVGGEDLATRAGPSPPACRRPSAPAGAPAHPRATPRTTRPARSPPPGRPRSRAGDPAGGAARASHPGASATATTMRFSSPAASRQPSRSARPPENGSRARMTASTAVRTAKVGHCHAPLNRQRRRERHTAIAGRSAMAASVARVARAGGSDSPCWRLPSARWISGPCTWAACPTPRRWRSSSACAPPARRA